MVANLVKTFLVLFVFLAVIKNYERQFATAKSINNLEVGTSSLRGQQDVEDRCKATWERCQWDSECCSTLCGGVPSKCLTW